MTTYVALLRGVNLGARNKVSMADLRTLIESLGAEDVQTYVQSGNVVFKSRVRSAAKLAGDIERQISGELGLEISVILRTNKQLAKIVAGNPFAAGQSEGTKLHVTFLAEAPKASLTRALEPEAFEPDEFQVKGREVYLHTPRATAGPSSATRTSRSNSGWPGPRATGTPSRSSRSSQAANSRPKTPGR